MDVSVIGGGLAGSEAAWQLARRGVKVTLYEMRPHFQTPAHQTGYLAELVCSNSLKSRELTNAHGLLKEELRLLGSVIMKAADACTIPGGKALVVDRMRFAQRITEMLEAEKHVRIVRKEATDVPAGVAIVATGPLTSQALSQAIRGLAGGENLYFFDAISPIVEGSSIDMEHAFFGSRYMADADDYLNCRLNKEEYETFYKALIQARRVDLRPFEDTRYFEGCLPIEVMAERGPLTLAYGPMKPVGIVDPVSGREPYAILQLRREDVEGHLYNMVGFQTKLTYPEQERVFRLIPALKHAVFHRYGSIHRNTFINAPELLTEGLRLKSDPRVLFAGQITGVEGYVESTAMGLVAALSALCAIKERRFIAPPADTCIGALVKYVTTPRKDFQPMNINFGLIAGYNKRRKEAVVTNALSSVAVWKQEIEEVLWS